MTTSTTTFNISNTNEQQQGNKDSSSNNNSNASAFLSTFLRVSPLHTEKGFDPSFFVDKNQLQVAGQDKGGAISLAFAAPGARVDRLRRTMSNVARRRGSMRKLSDAKALPLTAEDRALKGDLKIQYRGAFDEKVNDDTVGAAIAQSVAPLVAQRKNVTLCFSGPSLSGKSHLAKQVIPTILQHLGLKATLLLAEENHSEQLVFGTLKPIAERVRLSKHQHKHGLLEASEQASIEARQAKLRELAEAATAETNAQLSGTANKSKSSKNANNNDNNDENNNNNNDDGDDDINNNNNKDAFSPAAHRGSAATPQPGRPPRHGSLGSVIRGGDKLDEHLPDHRYELLVYAPPPRNRVLVLPDSHPQGGPPQQFGRSETPLGYGGGNRSVSQSQRRARSVGSNATGISHQSNAAGSPTRSVFSIAKVLRRPVIGSSPHQLIPKLIDDDEDLEAAKKAAEEEEAKKEEEDDKNRGINHPMFDHLREVIPSVTEPESVFHIPKNGRDSLMHPSFKMPESGPLNLPNNRLVDFALGDTEGGLGFFVWIKDSGECPEPAVLLDSIDTVDRSYNVRISLHCAEGDRHEPGSICVSIRDFHSKRLEVVFGEVCSDNEWHSYSIHVQPPVNLVSLAVDGVPARKRVVAAENPMTFFPERLKVTKVGAVATKAPDGSADVISSRLVDGHMYLFTLFESRTSKLIQQFTLTPDQIIVNPTTEDTSSNNNKNSNSNNKPSAGGAGSAFRNRNKKNDNNNNNAPPPPPRDPNDDKTQFKDICGGEPMVTPEPAAFSELAFVDSYPVFNGYSTFVNVGTLGNFGLYLPTCGVDITFKTSISNDQMCAIGLTDITGKHTGFGLELNTGVNMNYQRYSICFWIRDYDGNTSRCSIDASQVFDDRWHTFSVRALQLENAKFKIKIDGRTHETSASIPGAVTSKLLAFQSPCAIGAHFERGRQPTRFFNGAIRNVTLWQCIIESKVDTPIASWKLDDGPGSRIAVDSSGYLNHGVYSNHDPKSKVSILNKRLGMLKGGNNTSTASSNNNNKSNPGGAAAGSAGGGGGGSGVEVFRRQLLSCPPIGFVWPRFVPPAGDETEAAMRAATNQDGSGNSGGGGSSNAPRKSFANNVLKAACVAITTLVTDTGNAKEVVIDLFKEHAGSSQGPAFETPDDFQFELLREWDENGRAKDDRRVVRPLPQSYFSKITTTNYLNQCREALHRFDAYSENAHMVFQLCIGDSVFTVVDLLGMKRSHLAVFNPVQLSWRDVVSTVGDEAKQRTVMSRSTQAAEKALLDIGSKPQLFKRGQACLPSTRMPSGDIVADILTHSLTKGPEPCSLFLCQVIGTNTSEDNIRFTALWAERLRQTDKTNAVIILQKAFRAVIARRRFKKLDTLRRQRLAREYHNTMTKKQCARECEHRKNKIALLCFSNSFDKHEVSVESHRDPAYSLHNCEAEVPPLDFGRDPADLVTTLEDVGYTVTVYNDPRKETILNFIKDLMPKMASCEVQLLVYIAGYYVSHPINTRELQPTTTSVLQALSDEQNFERKQLVHDYKFETVELYKEYCKSVHEVQDIVKTRIADLNKKITIMSKKKKNFSKVQGMKDEVSTMEKGIAVNLYPRPSRVLMATQHWSSCEEPNELHLYKMADRLKHEKQEASQQMDHHEDDDDFGHHVGRSKLNAISRRQSHVSFVGSRKASSVMNRSTTSSSGGAGGGSYANAAAVRKASVSSSFRKTDAFVPFLDTEEAELCESEDGSEFDEDDSGDDGGALFPSSSSGINNNKDERIAKRVRPHHIDSVHIVLGRASATGVGETLSLRELEQNICGTMPRRGHHGICCYDLVPFVVNHPRADIPRSGFTVSSGETLRLLHPQRKFARWFTYYFMRGIRGSAIEAMRRGKRPVADYIDIEAMTKYMEQHAEKYPTSAQVEFIKYWGEYVGDIFFAPFHLMPKEIRQKTHTQNKPCLAVVKMSLHDPEETFMQILTSELHRLAKTGKTLEIKRSAFAPELHLGFDTVNLRSLLEHPFALEHMCEKFTKEAKKFVSAGVSSDAKFKYDLYGPSSTIRLRLVNEKSDKYDLASNLAPGVFTVTSTPNISGIADPKERCFKYTNLAEDVRCRVEETLIPFWRYLRDSKTEEKEQKDMMEESMSGMMAMGGRRRSSVHPAGLGRAGRMSFIGGPGLTRSNQGSRRGSFIGGAAGSSTSQHPLGGDGASAATTTTTTGRATRSQLAAVSPLPNSTHQLFSSTKMTLYLVIEMGEIDARNLDRASRISPDIGKIGKIEGCTVVSDKFIVEVDEHEKFFQQLDSFRAAEARARAAREAEQRKKIIEKYEGLLKQAADNSENQGRAIATGKLNQGANDIKLWFTLPLQSSIINSIAWTIKSVFGARNGSVIRSMLDSGFLPAIKHVAEESPFVLEPEKDPRDESEGDSSSSVNAGGPSTHNADGTLNLNAKPAPLRVQLMKLASSAVSLPPLSSFCDVVGPVTAQTEESGFTAILQNIVLPVFTVTRNKGPRLDKEETRAVIQTANAILTNRDNNLKDIWFDRSAATEKLVQVVARWCSTLLFDPSRQTLENTEGILTDRHHALQSVLPATIPLLGVANAALRRLSDELPVASDYAAMLEEKTKQEEKAKIELQEQQAAAAAAAASDGDDDDMNNTMMMGEKTMSAGTARSLFSASAGEYDEEIEPSQDRLVSSFIPLLKEIIDDVEQQQQNKEPPQINDARSLLIVVEFWSTLQLLTQKMSEYDLNNETVVRTTTAAEAAAAEQQQAAAAGTTTTEGEQQAPPPPKLPKSEFSNALKFVTANNIMNLAENLITSKSCRSTFVKLKKDPTQQSNNTNSILSQCQALLRRLPDVTRGGLTIMAPEYSPSA